MNVKNDTYGIEVSPELISKFIMGKATVEEWLAVMVAMRKDPQVMEIVTTSMRVNERRMTRLIRKAHICYLILS